MITIIILYIIVMALAIIGYQYRGMVLKKNGYSYILNIAFLTGLVLFATFRSQDLPDYKSYMDLFKLSSQGRPSNVEPLFFIICSIARKLSPVNGWFVLLFIYASLGISIKYYAIRKYSPYVVFSLSIWLASFFILHDLIQMRASVASGLLLLFLPEIQKRNYIKAIILFIIAFYFHNSAIIFIPLLFLNAQSINWRLWTIVYIILLMINVTGDFSGYVNKILGMLPGIDNARLSSYIVHGNELLSGDKTNMFSPYILFQSLVCFTSLYSIKRLQSASQYAVIWLKCCFISIFIYSLSIPGISMRLAELLSIPQIFLVPLLITVFPSKYYKIGNLLIIFIALFWLTFFIFNLHFIPL